MYQHNYCATILVIRGVIIGGGMPYKVFKRGEKWQVYKVDDGDQPMGESLGEHDDEEMAKRQMRALYAREGKHSSDFVMSEYIATQPGEPYRLLKFGPLWKGGKRREITPELAASFRLPHFKPPIKLGSHDDRTPAGGHITGLEVREDGLYAINELNEEGIKALAAGNYRYQSPEIIWEMGLEDPTTGDLIPGPLIIGDALLHTPHLGEAAALYTYTEVKPMEESEKNFYEKFTAFLDKVLAKKEPELVPEPEAPVITVDQMTAIEKERDEYAAKLAAIEAAQVKQARVEKFGAELKETKADQNADMLSSMTDEQADWVLAQFKALSAQINESNLTAELGSTGVGADTDPVMALHNAVKAKMSELSVDYNTAIKHVDQALVSAAYK